MTTSDGISREDWDVVHELAVSLFNAETEAQEALCRSRLLKYLDELERRYGLLPSILATRADFVHDRATKESLLKDAYSLARDRSDHVNALYVAHSLTELYIDSVKNYAEARTWLERLGEHLDRVKDPSFMRDYERWLKALASREENGM